jgi:hypothetical protein
VTSSSALPFRIATIEPPGSASKSGIPLPVVTIRSWSRSQAASGADAVSRGWRWIVTAMSLD